ncbi:glycosyltransferase family 2 protein, partial [Candidatus Neomarinimicrobiota bacterium]
SSIINSNLVPSSVIILAHDDQLSKFDNYDINIHFVNQGKTISESFFNAVNYLNTDHFIYINNSRFPVKIKQDCAELFLFKMKNNAQIGMCYTDYDINDNDRVRSVNLLKHHSGRLRDNQDYGHVFFLNRQTVQNCQNDRITNIDNLIYSMRLNIFESQEISHISSAKGGSPYTVYKPISGLDVFDYLVADEFVQHEAEAILTDHLKRINSYLSPGLSFEDRPTPAIKPDCKATVIIPVNNRPEFIGTAIDSIQNQSVQDIETIIVVNGGSRDKTIEVIQQYQKNGSRYDPEKPPVNMIISDINNIGYSLNQGINHAKGEFYVQLDSDDRLKLTAIEQILNCFAYDKSIGIVIGSYELWDLAEDGTLIQRTDLPSVTHREWTEQNGRNNLLRVNGAGAPRAIPIQLIKDIGYFQMNSEPYAINYGEDYDMVLRISEKYRVGRIYDPIYDVIRHRGGTDHSIDQRTIDRNDEAKDYIRLKTILRRKEINLEAKN